MFPRNNNIGEINILQNQFTAYLVKAVRRRRARYLHSKIVQAKCEIPLNVNSPHPALRVEQDLTVNLPLLSQFENEHLALGMEKLNDRELRIVTMKVLEKRSLQEIADEFHSKRAAISTTYYRALQKLKAELGAKC